MHLYVLLQVTFTLKDLEQRGNDVVANFIPVPSTNCQVPQEETTPLPGCQQFMKLQDFKSSYHRFVQDDTLFLEIEVDRPKQLS